MGPLGKIRLGRQDFDLKSKSTEIKTQFSVII